MKKALFLAAVASLFTFVSCQKEETPNRDKNGDLVFTATIECSTKTSIDAVEGKISWVSGDEITIEDNTKVKAVYTVSSIDAGVATFTKTSGSTLGVGPYTAVYGSDPSATQDYSPTVPSLPMSAQSETTTLTFTVSCGLLELSVTAASDETTKDVSKIEIMGKPSGGTITIYTLNCSETQDISSEKKFYIALPAGSYSVIKLTNSTGHISYKSATSAMELSSNTIQPKSIPVLKFDDVLPGKFTVNESGDQVRFSKGNLYYNGSTWNFEDNQYDYRTYDGKYSCIDGSVTTNGTPTNHWGLFCWSTDNQNNNYGMFTQNTSSLYNGNFVDWGKNFADPWHTLSTDQWAYILNTENASNGARTQTNRFAKAKVNGVNGLLIFPDGYNGTTKVSGIEGIAAVNTSNASFPDNSVESSTWTIMEFAGCVFLPASGEYSNGSVKKVGATGEYWSSTPIGNNSARCLCFEQPKTSSVDEVSRSKRMSVRLVNAAQ